MQNKVRIAYLEDEAAQSAVVVDWLNSAGYSCRHYNNAQSFLREIRRASYDMFVLDWELPDGSGIDVLERIRSQSSWNAPVLFLTQRDSDADMVLALDKGADDYITKPIKRSVMLARIKALLRRTGRDEQKNAILEYGPYRINLNDSSITVSDNPVELTEKEHQLAVLLFSNIGRLLSRDYMLEMVWGLGPGLATRTVDTHISRLRRKLDLSPENGWRLKAIYHHGYRLEQISQNEDDDTD